jgi:hypothetical protein
MNTYEIKVTWNQMFPERVVALGGTVITAEKTFEFKSETSMSIDEICEAVYRDTNWYQGSVWEAMQPLPEVRSHTALSIGDVVTVNGIEMLCSEFGFQCQNVDKLLAMCLASA